MIIGTDRLKFGVIWRLEKYHYGIWPGVPGDLGRKITTRLTQYQNTRQSYKTYDWRGNIEHEGGNVNNINVNLCFPLYRPVSTGRLLDLRPLRQEWRHGNNSHNDFCSHFDRSSLSIIDNAPFCRFWVNDHPTTPCSTIPPQRCVKLFKMGKASLPSIAKRPRWYPSISYWRPSTIQILVSIDCTTIDIQIRHAPSTQSQNPPPNRYPAIASAPWASRETKSERKTIALCIIQSSTRWCWITRDSKGRIYHNSYAEG